MKMNLTNRNASIKRERFLKLMLHKLCIDIGPRPAGSANYNKSVGIIKNELSKCVKNVEIDKFYFNYWELEDKPKLTLGPDDLPDDLEVWPYYGSRSTPTGGINGRITKLKTKEETVYALCDANSNEIRAYIVISPFGKAVPRFAWKSMYKMLPAVTIGRQDKNILEKAIINGFHANLTFRAKTVKNKVSYSTIGYIPGEKKDEILFLAHADTQINTPGANDNTASLITMLMIACELSKTKRKYSITFAATGGEETGHVGSKHYAELRKERGDIHRIKISINFDSLTYGPNMIIYSKDKELSNSIAEIYKKLKLRGSPKIINENDNLDGEVFIKAGARGVYINTRGYDETKLQLWHRPEDRPETVDFELAENGFLVFTELVKYIEAKG
ncbi:MAG: M20/M25/M40 family metallo-hydrolase [Spirochaetales bacterium]|nr:M20/M25/M40 family metallo-hydrolase [Spirochaetales bacterium]